MSNCLTLCAASLAILSLILYFAARGTSYFLTPTYLFGKVYANSLLVTFNNRIYLMGMHKKIPSSNDSSSSGSRPLPPRPSGVSSFKIEPFNRVRESMEMCDVVNVCQFLFCLERWHHSNRFFQERSKLRSPTAIPPSSVINV